MPALPYVNPKIGSILETSAGVTTILQFLTGVLICAKYIRKKSTGDSSGLSFVCGFLSCSLWFYYGKLTGEDIVIAVNTVGSLLMLSYVVIYYIFTANRIKHIQQFVTSFVFLIIIRIFVAWKDDLDTAIFIVGNLACIVTVLFFAAPLTMLIHVIKVKNSESLPFPLILASFVVCLQWLIYGYIKNDLFLQIPNLLGCLLSGSQLSLFVIYPPNKYPGQPYKLLSQNSEIL